MKNGMTLEQHILMAQDLKTIREKILGIKLTVHDAYGSKPASYINTVDTALLRLQAFLDSAMRDNRIIGDDDLSIYHGPLVRE